MITSKTHRFIKITPYKKISKNNAKLMWGDYGEYLEFYKNLLKFSINKGYDEHFEIEYMLGPMDSSMEELHEITGIKICVANSLDRIYCIPKTKENDKIYYYIIENVPCEFKILKRTRGTYCDYGPQNFYRKMYKKNYNDFISKNSK
jgi:hypothetical protein